MTRGKADRQKTKKKNRPRTRRLTNALILVVSGLVIFSVCVLWVNWPSASQQTPDTNVNVPKAAILDGLYEKSPNLTWTKIMVQYLSNAGYMVDVYRGTNVTIDLLSSIGGYEILILRLHSAVHTDGCLYVFSGEEYTESKYVNEQLAGFVRKAYTFNESEPAYFALNSMFIGDKKPNGLNGTTMILTGCNGTANQYMIQSFLQEGVKAYVSWDGYVDLSYSDEATLRLVKAMCTEGLSPKAAVEEVNREVGPDPFYQSELVCNLP